MNKKKSFVEYMCWFATIFGIYLLVSAIVIDAYFNYKAHEYIEYHNEDYVLHKYCISIYNYYYCSDD